MAEWIECPKCGTLYRGEHKCPKSKEEAEKIYWRDITSTMKIVDKGTHYEADGKVIFWHGSEASEAHEFLTTKAVKVATATIPAELLDHIASFELEVNMDDWVDLYLKASKSLGKVLGRSTAEHLWTKFRDMGIIRMWGLLDKDNRKIIVEMLNMWKR